MPQPALQLLRERIEGSLLYQVLLRQVWFRRVAIAGGTVLLLSGLSLLRVWTSSPAGLMPPVKVSLLDLFQAWSLDRSAGRLAGRGLEVAAAQAWRAALVNNRADPELLRRLLGHFVQSELTVREFPGPVLAHSEWLLELTGTNRADVTLACAVYDKLELEEPIFALLKPRAEELSQSERAVYLKALARSGDWTEFGRHWEAWGAQWRQHRDVALYHAAYLAGWGPPGEIQAGRARLEAAVQERDLRLLANRLLLEVCERLLDYEGFLAALDRLERAQADRVADHVRHWHLLVALGRRAEAHRLATEFRRPPQTAWDLITPAHAYLELGLDTQTRELLRACVSDWADPSQPVGQRLWLLYAQTLVSLRAWDELRAVAIQLRLVGQGQHPLTGFSHYLEGRAEYGLQHATQAQLALEQSAALGIPDATLALQVAADLLRMDAPQAAAQVLAAHATAQAKNPTYWEAVFAAHLVLRQDANALLQAASRAHDLVPGNAIFRNNYAAALLINRRFPEEALRLTSQLRRESPDTPAARCNHALALVLNRRYVDAELQLAALDLDRLTEAEATYYFMIRFELFVQAQDHAGARRAAERIQRRFLFSNQLDWLDRQCAQWFPSGAARSE